MARHKRRLKANLVEAGIQQREVARKVGVTPGAVSRVLNGSLRSQRIEDAIKASIAAGQRRVRR